MCCERELLELCIKSRGHTHEVVLFLNFCVRSEEEKREDAMKYNRIIIKREGGGTGKETRGRRLLWLYFLS